MPDTAPPDWERVLLAAARLQQILPAAVLVGGTASALHAHHRSSTDADHVLSDLRDRFDAVLAELEAVAGWRTARVQRPVQILGNLDGIDTGIRQLIRTRPLETARVEVEGVTLTVPTAAEILRIKAALILRRNATRDYLDVAALTDTLGQEATLAALANLDALYPQPTGASALQQLAIQLAQPQPFDLKSVSLAEYKHLQPRWHDWNEVKHISAETAIALFDRLGQQRAARTLPAAVQAHILDAQASARTAREPTPPPKTTDQENPTVPQDTRSPTTHDDR